MAWVVQGGRSAASVSGSTVAPPMAMALAMTEGTRAEPRPSATSAIAAAQSGATCAMEGGAPVAASAATSPSTARGAAA